MAGTQITLVCSKTNLTDLYPLERPLSWASAAQGQCHQATHGATLNLPLVAKDGGVHYFAIKGVYYAEHARLNAVSPTDLYKAGVAFKYQSNEPEDTVVSFQHEGGTKEGQVIWIETLPFLPTPALAQAYGRNTATTPLAAAVLGSLPSHDYVHLVFDHTSSPTLRRLWERSVGLIERPQSFQHLVQCHTCMETRNRIAKANPTALPETVMKRDDLWCMDLLDLPRAASFEGNCHCLLIVDAFSSYIVSLFSPTKNGHIAQLSRYLIWHNNYTSRHPKFFQMDGAGELKGSEITELMHKYHISPRYSEP